MTDFIEILPAKKIDATVVLPGSKSETIRALICAALAEGDSRLHNALFCDDTAVVVECLQRLGFAVETDRQKALIEVRGGGGKIPADRARLDLKSCAAAMRFLASVSSLGRGEYHFDGEAGLRKRPLLVPVSDESTGTWILFHERDGFLPFTVVSHGVERIDAKIDCTATSQALSSLLLVGPCAKNGARISLVGGAASEPYVHLTAKVMSAFGAEVAVQNDGARIESISCSGKYVGRDYTIEGDASSATYFLAAAAITGGRVRVVGFKKDSVQADARFPDVLERMGCKVEWSDNAVAVTGGKLRAVDADFRAMPDAAPAFAVVAAFAEGTSTLTGVENLRLKESDRVESIAACLAAIGAEVETGKDFIRVSPGALRGATIDPRGDHRIAMSFAVAGLEVRGVKILDPECVRKSLPHYFSYLRNLSE